MKKLLLLIPLLIIACKKEKSVAEIPNQDSTVISEQPDPASTMDSAVIKDSAMNNSSESPQVSRMGMMRSEKNGQIIRTASASQLPFALGEEFTKDDQELIIKLTNYNKPEIKAKITTNIKDFNIRFNQIKLPNGEYDGPFGRDIKYKIPEKGEVWLIIGKSNMASGNTEGSFSVSIE